MSLLESMQNVSHSVIGVVHRFFRSNHDSEVDREIIAALHEDHDEWEKLSAESLETFEKRFE
jgi:hypothetical protein